jgi:formate hydrogenlyase subunit 4
MLFSLIANIFIPWGISSSVSAAALGLGLVTFVIKISVFAVFVAFLESSIAKWRLFRVPDLIAVAIASSLVGLVLYYI